MFGDCDCDDAYTPRVDGLGGVMAPMNPLGMAPTPQRKAFDEARYGALNDFTSLVYLAQSMAHFLGL